MKDHPSISITHEFKMKHILIVDDDASLSGVWKNLLESNDFLVSTAHNGVDALKLIMNLDVDVIVCDLMMPKMAGDMFYIAVERVKPHLCSRFIFVTGYERHPKFSAFLERINPVVLYKPVTHGRLLGTINVIFSRLAQKAAGQKIA